MRTVTSAAGQCLGLLVRCHLLRDDGIQLRHRRHVGKDPGRLMRLFGITSHTAIHYVRAAHPERFTIDPTQA
ncbi:hypothetical protein [Streptomyces sp. NPDC054786]